MTTNIITKFHLETACADLSKQGLTIREIARRLALSAKVSVSPSAVFRYLKQTEMKQIALPELKQDILSDVNLSTTNLKQAAPPKIMKITFKKPDDNLEVQRSWTYWR